MRSVSDILMAVIALAVLAVFLGILAWRVPRLDLAAVITITLLLATWDLISSARRRPRHPRHDRPPETT